ncbi:hypothetical protein K402DRAFT_306 [Aulographum hederae CBS 113979]|uniref:BZIP domain-containing protein n=1 Tax=Aulographum hederae CBS 113979 TaxID=1176131 RepID=A0A6G1HG65_9PEZI|nr:hypothetical protein K402DRAFT_306 [Aulographum hederae CBS 113979]
MMDREHDQRNLAREKQKRVLTEARRRQNREAQMRFKQRRKGVTGNGKAHTNPSDIHAVPGSDELNADKFAVNINTVRDSSPVRVGNYQFQERLVSLHSPMR